MRLPSSRRVAGLVVLAVVAAGIVLDAFADPGPAPPAGLGPTVPATSGAWFCGAGRTAQENGVQTVTAVAPSSDRGAARTSVAVFDDGQRRGVGDQEVGAGAAVTHDLPRGLAHSGVVARWWETPAVTTRFWRLREDGSSPRLVAGPCQAATSVRWIIPGLATAGGATAEIVLANPHDTDASVQVSIPTPDGLREPRLLENIAVPARSSRTVSLNEHAPAQGDLGAIVTVRAGRIVVEGVQQMDAAIGGVDGASLLAAAPEPATRWTVPSYRAPSDTTESWLWVTNPTQAAATVTLEVHTTRRAVVPENAGETTVGPGEVRRIDLRNLVDAEQSAVTVTSDNDVPVVVSGATVVDQGPEARTGLAVQLAAPAPDASWVTTFPAGSRRAHLDVVNPGEEAAVVSVSLWAGDRRHAPGPLREVRVPPGALVRLDLQRFLPDAPLATVFVRATSGKVVAGVESYAISGTYDLVAHPGVSGAVSEGAAAPPVRFEPGMTGRLGTTTGITPTAVPTSAPGESGQDRVPPLLPVRDGDDPG